MCGIVAAVSPAANIVPVLLEGLRKLEYRGYDSAGIAVLNGAGVQRMRTADRLRIADTSGAPVERPVVVSQLSADAVELGQYRHYMQKEIFEQPEALANTLELIGNGGRLQPGIFGAEAASLLDGVRSVLILACGTSYHSGVTARYWLESLAAIPCTVEIASEYRYRGSVPDPDRLVVAISQSGETADTLAALRHAKDLGHTRTLAICNVPESAIVRECALRFITRAGPEIGVASTKAFTTQLAALFLLTLVVGKLRGRIDEQAEHDHLARLRHLPVAVARVLELEPSIQAWAQNIAHRHHALFLGRGRHWPIALEGSLKLKEISYTYKDIEDAIVNSEPIRAFVRINLPPEARAIAPSCHDAKQLGPELDDRRSQHALGLDACLAGRVEPQQVHHDVANDGQVVGGIAAAHP